MVRSRRPIQRHLRASFSPHDYVRRGAWRARGFSVVELITVLMLVAILSVVGISRSVTPSSFEAAIVSQFLVSELRFARRTAMNRQDVSVVLVLSRTADQVVVVLQTPASINLRTRSVARGRVELQAATEVLDLGESFVIGLDGAGRISTITLSGVPAVAADGLQINATSERSVPLCLFPSGYAVDEACV